MALPILGHRCGNCGHALPASFSMTSGGLAVPLTDTTEELVLNMRCPKCSYMAKFTLAHGSVEPPERFSRREVETAPRVEVIPAERRLPAIPPKGTKRFTR